MTLKAAVISLGSKSSKMVVKALSSYIRTVDDINLKDIEVSISSKGGLEILHKGEPLEEYDCIYAKGSFRYAPLLRAITQIANKKAYMPIAAETFTIAHDKILSQLEMQKKNIPMPKTYIASTPSDAKKVLKKMNYPVIMKFPQGTQGKGVMFADSFAAANSMLDALSSTKQPFLIQEYIETGGADLRVIVVGDQVAATMQRKAAVGEKRANIHAGGTGEAYKIDPVTKKIAVETAKAVQADICAVDILESIKGPLVIEVNISPGLQGVTQATGIDVAKKIAKFLHQKAKDFSSVKKGEATKEIMDEISSLGPGKEIITVLDFRGERILLPEVITKEAKFTDKDDVILKVEKGRLVIEKFDIGNK